jgi:hypothetical protein
VTDYRLYYLRAGHIARCEAFEAEGDAAALAQAEARRRGQAAELWNRARMVAWFDPAPATATA